MVDCSHAFCVQPELLLLAQGSWQPLATVTPAALVASAAEPSEPRCTDTASAKLLIFAYGVVLFKVRKLFLICGEEGSDPYIYMYIYNTNAYVYDEFINLPVCFITFDDVAIGCSKVSVF